MVSIKKDLCPEAPPNMYSQVWDLVSSIPDPEVPCITIHDLGIIRKLDIIENQVIIKLTPTYSGCPAINAIELAVEEKLRENGFIPVVERVLSPPWTSDWITKEGKKKLKAYGIAPPPPVTDIEESSFFSTQSVACPKCNSSNTKKVSHFGSTACKAQYSCNSCLEPFELFKCI